MRLTQAQYGAMVGSKPSTLSGPTARVQCARLDAKRDGFSQLLLDIALWRSLVAYLGSPFRRLFAFVLLSGGSGTTLLAYTIELVWRCMGWLSASPDSLPLRRLERQLTGLRRWHLAMGNPCCRAARLLGVVSSCLRRLCAELACQTSSTLMRAQGLTRPGVLAAMLMAVAGVRVGARRIKEATDERKRRMRGCLASMASARTFPEWSEAATQLNSLRDVDSHANRVRWHRQVKLYDHKLLQQRLRHLQHVRGSGKVADMIFAVRADLLRNLGNMTNRSALDHPSSLHHNAVTMETIDRSCMLCSCL